MRRVLLLASLVLVLAACGGSSTKASGDECFKIWNDSSNQRRQEIVAALSVSVANVSTTSDNCGYTFHDKKRFLSINARREGSNVRWDDLPSAGDWHKGAPDNAAVEIDGKIRQR